MALQNVIHYHSCPVCNSTSIAQVLCAEDYTATHESFAIWECSSCTFRFTQDVPGESVISRYYAAVDYISHSDEAPGLVNTIYKQARKYTLGQKAKWIEKFHAPAIPKSLLDIGAGTGAFAALMQTQQWQVTALEPDEGARAAALQQHGLVCLPTERLFEFPTDAFSIITMWHVLEHVHRLHDYIAVLKKILQKQGTLLIAVPNYTSPDAKHYQEHWAAYDVPRHLYHFSPLAMSRLLQQHEFKIAATIPLQLDAFYIALLSEKYKTGKTNWLAAGLQGAQTFAATWRNPHLASSLLYVVQHQ